MPSEPSTGVATVQPPVSFGQAGAGGTAFDVVGLQILRGGAGEHLLFGRFAGDVADRLAGDEREVVVDRREARRELAAVRPARTAVKSWLPFW